MKKTYMSPSIKVKTLGLQPYMLVFSDPNWIQVIDEEDEETDADARTNKFNVWE